jgi:polyphosphate kinase
MAIVDPLTEDRFINRELSRIDFNARVLALTEDSSIPLLERLKFLAIFASNLDEFYMVRVAGLKRQAEVGIVARSPEGKTALEQLAEIAEKVHPLVQRHAEIFSSDVMPALAAKGVRILRWSDLGPTAKTTLEKLFRERIFPVLTPLAVDSGHPFPYISNLSLSLAVQVRDRRAERTHFARVKVPGVLPRFVSTPEEEAFVPLEDLIAAHLDQLFPGMDIVEHHAFRVTRNADLEINDDGAEDLLQLLEEELQRMRFSPAVRLETERSMPEHVLDLLMRELEIEPVDVHRLPGLLDLGGLWPLYEIDRRDLKDEPFHPPPYPAFPASEDGFVDVFAEVRQRDLLVHHPYDSFSSTVERFIEQAATDPDVLAIKQTLYRTSGDSPIIDALIEAAESGKQVVVLVEIKARGDERANIGWARTLEKAGCHVVYGLLGLKTHAKLCLVVRQEASVLRRYVHFGTGNYNPKTARNYEDLGILTTNPDIGSEVSHLFNYLTGYSLRPHYRSLVVAPQDMRKRIISLIEREAEHSSEGHPGRVVIKVNGLVDERVIDAIYRGSQAGVRFDLWVRSMCSLRPGVAGLSENVRVRSIVGRFLEHSRIFYFHNRGKEEVYMGSADLMERNLDRRVEVLVRVESAPLKARLKALLELGFSDNSCAWVLDQDGNWTRLQPGDEEEGINQQEELMKRAGGDA